MKRGIYNRIEYEIYPAAASHSKDEKKSLNIKLKPNFGNIYVTSEPEDGMQIFLDDNNTGKTTPALLTEISSGKHSLQLKDTWYYANAELVYVNDNDTTDVNIHIYKTFANLRIKANPGTSLYIDNQKKGTGEWEGRLLPGIYSVKAEKTSITRGKQVKKLP
jgi:hypothetical protein